MDQQQTTLLAGTGISTGFGDGPWADPGNITATDGNYAYWQATMGGQMSEQLQGSNFGFNIPPTAVIDGVAITFVPGFVFSWFGWFTLNTDDGSSVSQDLDSGFVTYGGLGEFFGMTLTPALVNNSNFGVSVQAADISGGDAQVNIDSISITVYWHLGGEVDPAEVPLHHDYKVYSENGEYLGNIPNVISEFDSTLDINSVGSQLDITAAGTPDGQKPLIALGGLTRWLQGDWPYRHKITVERTKVNGDLTGFPVYLDLSLMPKHFWDNLATAGADIRITDSYGMQELAFHIVNINLSTKTGELWFNAPLITNLFDNAFYIYYGNPTATAYSATDPYGSQKAWASYMGVYHLQANANDSTVEANNGAGVNTPTYPAGKLGNGLLLNGSNQYINLGGATTGLDNDMAGRTSYNFSGWFKLTTPGTTGALRTILAVNTAAGGNTLLIGIQAGANGVDVNDGSAWEITGTTPVTDGNWHHFSYNRNANIGAFRIDGITQGTHTANHAFVAGDLWSLGQEWDTATPSDFWPGMIDEFKVRVPSTDGPIWAAAEFANQSDVATFITLGEKYETETYENGDGTLIRNGNLVEVYETSYYYPNGKRMYSGQINRIEGEVGGQVNGEIKIKLHSDGRDLDSVIARGAPFSYTNDQSQTASNAYYTVTQTADQYNRVGQTWVVGNSITNLGRIRLRLQGNATVTVTIYNGAYISILGSVSRAVNVGSPTVVDFILPNFINVTQGQILSIGIGVNVGRSMRVYFQDNTNPYANGSMYTAQFAGGGGGGHYQISNNDDLYFTTAYATPSTQATYTSQDPTTGMLDPIMADYNLRGGLIRLADYDPTGLVLTAAFNTNTVYEAIEKILEMSPTGFYYYVDLGTNELVMKETSRTADWIITKGVQMESLQLVLSIENVVNDVLFSGGEVTPGVNLYINRFDGTSKKLYGTRLDRKSDNRVTVSATGQAMANSMIAEHKGEQYYTSLRVVARSMDITLFKPGQTIGFRNFGSWIDNLLVQVTRVHYTAGAVDLQIGTLPLRFNSSFEQTIRGLVAQQTINNPSTPS